VVVKKVDVTSKEDIHSLATDISGLDILFNCAGYIYVYTYTYLGYSILT
jgi:hypothetical protein